jgi:hypothetical protein
MRTEHAAVSDTAPLVPAFLDRLGDRVQLTDRESGHVEVLRLRPELTASPFFEPAVRRRAEQLARFLHPNCARVRQIGRLPAPDGRLVIMSDAIDGWRLSEVLEAAGPCGVALHADAVLFLLRQLLSAVADLHEVALGISHGALGTERLVITADGRLVVTECVLGAALRHLPPTSTDRLWRDLRLAVADGEAQPFGRLTDLRQIGVVALSLALGRQLRRDEYPTRLAGLLKEWPPARPGLDAEAPGPAFREWLLRVLSLTDDLTPWSVAEARRELDRLVESDPRCAFAPTGLPVVLETVADYYAAAAEVPVPIEEPPAPPDKRAGPVQVRPPEPVSQPVLEVAEAPLDDSWPEPLVRPAVDQLVDSQQEPPIETHSASMFAEPQSPWGDAEGQSPPSPDANAPQARLLPISIVAVKSEPVGQACLLSGAPDGPALGVLPLADSIGTEWSKAVAEDTLDAFAAPSGTRTRTLIGIAAAALIVVALGGYALVRPSSVSATATRRASSPDSTAVADTTSPTPTPSAASVSPADTLRTPSDPRTPEALPPAAAPAPPVSTGIIEVVSTVPLNVSEGGRALGASGALIQVSVGRHTLDIGREDLGYQAVQVVDVKPGQPHRIQPSLPSGIANLNATPWAEVWIDGRNVGETPLGHVQLTIGPHEVQFRHPELGNQTRTLVVTTGSVALLSVDLKK